MSHRARRVGTGGAAAAPPLLLLLPIVSSLIVVFASAAPLDVVPLPYAADKYKAIDAQTMTLHHDKHYASYVTRYNAAVSSAANGSAVDASTPLPVALSLVGSPSLSSSADGLGAAVRNQGGGAWNHALFWKTLSPLGAPETVFASAASSALKRAVDADLGGPEGLKAAMAKAAAGVFGSGWAFLCAMAPPLSGGKAGATTRASNNGTAGTGMSASGGGKMLPSPVAAALPPPRLAVVTAPNQDSPLTGMGMASAQTERCVPIAGIDVWEHAYYLKYQNRRPEYIEAVLGLAPAPPANATAATTDGLINWAAVSRNYERVARAADIGGDSALLAAAGEIGQA